MGETSVRGWEATPWFTVGFDQKVSERGAKGSRKTRKGLFSEERKGGSQRLKPPFSAQNGEKREKFSGNLRYPTVKRVIGEALWAA